MNVQGVPHKLTHDTGFSEQALLSCRWRTVMPTASHVEGPDLS